MVAQAAGLPDISSSSNNANSESTDNKSGSSIDNKSGSSIDNKIIIAIIMIIIEYVDIIHFNVYHLNWQFITKYLSFIISLICFIRLEAFQPPRAVELNFGVCSNSRPAFDEIRGKSADGMTAVKQKSLNGRFQELLKFLTLSFEFQWPLNLVSNTIELKFYSLVIIHTF